MAGISFRGGVALAISALLTSASLAQDVSPELADSWAFMQETMPGVPYEVLKGACEEANLLIYHGAWVTAQDAQVAGFQKRFPCVNVRQFTATTGELRERFMSEVRAGRQGADIYQDADTGTLNSMASEGIIAEYKIANDHAFAAGAKKSGWWYSLRVALLGIAWNTDLVSEEDAARLADWTGLLDDRWKDVGIVIDPSGGGVAYSAWYAWNELYGPDFIKRIGELKPRVTQGINSAAASLASGDIQIIFNASETGLLPLWERGAPIQWALPTPGVGPLTGQVIAANAPHPNAARLYQEYAFTTEGYELWHKFGGASTRIGLEDQRDVAREPWYKLPGELFTYNTAEATKALPKILDLFREHVSGIR